MPQKKAKKEDKKVIKTVIKNVKQPLLKNDEKNIYNIIEKNEDTIKINESIEGEECFITGSKVDDFHTLDKNYIYTLNVCATQEIYKLIQQQNKIIQDLQNRISILENK